MLAFYMLMLILACTPIQNDTNDSDNAIFLVIHG